MGIQFFFQNNAYVNAHTLEDFLKVEDADIFHFFLQKW